MKFTLRTLAVVAPIGLGACLLLTSVGMSQNARNQEKANGGIRIPGFRPINPNAPIVSQPGIVNQPTVNPDLLLTPEQKTEKRIAALEATVVAQQKTIDLLKQSVFAAPAGYSRAFTTVYNFKRLPDTEGVSYWARMNK